MRFFTTIATLGATIGAAIAQTTGFHALTKPGLNEEVPSGGTYTITWNVASEYAGEKVTIGLLGGNSGATLHSVGTIGTADGDAGSFTWNVDSSLGTEKTYGIIISLASDSTVFQYSTPFSISGGSVKQDAPSSTSATKKAPTTTPTPTPTTTASSKKEKSETTETTSTSSEETSTTTSSETTSFGTTLSTVTTNKPADQVTLSSTTTSNTSTATSEPSKSTAGKLSIGAWIGIVAGGIAGVAVLLGMISMVFKMRRRQENERYQDIDGKY